MNFRKSLYFFLVSLRGHQLGKYYRQYHREFHTDSIPSDTVDKALVKLLDHAKEFVPYYAKIMNQLGDSYVDDPRAYLRKFPILTKDMIKGNIQHLKSADLSKRKWFYKTSGGSTGEPVRLIQDRQYATKNFAVTTLFSEIIGREIGESEILLWGSDRDISGNTESWKARLLNKISDKKFFSVYQLTPQRIRNYIEILNKSKPNLIVAYVHDLYEISRFAENKSLEVRPQNAIITSAGTLLPLMRQTIERVFQCKVYDRYGSREVGSIACELPGKIGLWVAPWNNYIEILDENGEPVPDGVEGDIVITSLNNYAMPLIRYYIADRGVLIPDSEKEPEAAHEQVIKAVLGRTVDRFVNKDGVLIDTIYFNILFSHIDWVSKYQVRQKNHSCIKHKIVNSYVPSSDDINHVILESRKIMADPDCQIEFEFVNEISPSPSGKYLYSLSDLQK